MEAVANESGEIQERQRQQITSVLKPNKFNKPTRSRATKHFIIESDVMKYIFSIMLAHRFGHF